MVRTSNVALGAGLSVLAGIGVASYMSGRRAVPSLSGVQRLAGLDDSVEVIRDQHGVPALLASSEDDLFFAQGYLHAADRLFQLDLHRRAALGRLAEVVGEAALASDRLVRVLGFGAAAADEAARVAPETRQVLDHYARGVNHYIETHRRRLPVEFGLLRYRPEPWLPQHTLAIPRLLALGLGANWEAELARAEIAHRFGDEALRVVEHDIEPPAEGTAVDAEVLRRLADAACAASASFGGNGAGIGSNSWVIGARRTGRSALLANDVHLDLSLPSLWYEQLLRCPTFEARGFSIPGCPAVVIGHNGRIAWGFTNVGADTQDLYLEQLDEQAGTYRDVDGDRPLEVREEHVRVRGRRKPVVQRVRETRRGPLITDVVAAQLHAQPMSLRWQGIAAGGLFDAALALNRARSWPEFRDALRGWTSPPQNVTYADVHGNIGYQLAGEIPVRRAGDGTTPRRGDDPEAEWDGTIPFDDLPSAFNPPADCIVRANERVVDDAYPYVITTTWLNDYRARRIGDLIDARDGHTVDDQARMQCDVRSLAGEQVVQLLRKLDPQPSTAAGRKALLLLLTWDLELRADDDAAEAWRLFVRALHEQAFGFLGELAPLLLGSSRAGFTGCWTLPNRGLPRLISDIERDDTALLELGRRSGQPGQQWRPAASWRELLAAALDAAGSMLAPGGDGDGDGRPVGRSLPGLDDIAAGLDQLMSRRRRFHRVRLQHPLGNVPGMSMVANRGPFPMPGDTDTVWMSAPFATTMNDAAMIGPSMRMVVDMANLDRAAAVVPGGQSGHAASPHYDDQLKLWRAGRLRPAPWTRDGIERAAKYHQRLEPA